MKRTSAYIAYIWAIVALASLLVSTVPEARSADAVRVLFFYSSDCEDCAVIKAGLVPELQETYGEDLEFRFLEVAEPDNYSMLMALEEQQGRQGSSVPIVFLCEGMAAGPAEVRDALPGMISEGVLAGGCDWPDPPARETITSSRDFPLEVFYFYEPGCKACDRVSLMLDHVKTVYPSITLEEINLRGPEAKQLEEAMAELVGIPEEKRLLAPALFIGREALVKNDITDGSIRDAIERQMSLRPVSLRDEADAALGQAQSRIAERFKGMGVLAVIVAALVDSINPCAIATLIFRISYLSVVGRKGRDLIIVGCAFAGGVFVAYFAIGLGLFRLLLAAHLMVVLRRIIYGILGLACLVFGILSASDAMKSRRGQHEDMKLQLPAFLKREIHKTIRTGVRMSRFAVGAAVTGIIISVLEFACTGQIYLPVIGYMVSVPELRGRAIPLLVLYNVIFVLPLVVVFIAARYGVASSRMERLARTHTGAVKWLTAILFLALSAYLIKTAAGV